MMRSTFICSNCLMSFKYINNEEWNEQKASEEFIRLYPEAKDHKVEILCDDCNLQFRKWFNKLTDGEKLKMREEYVKSL